MKCTVCGQRKGKRSCPAKGAVICAQCCGEKRVLEIDCPDDCQFLESGREYEKTLIGDRTLNTSDPVKFQKQRRTLARLKEVVALLEYILGDQRRVARDFTDEKAAEAVKLVADTLRTEDRGILYERTSSDPLVDSARRQLADAIARLRGPKEVGAEPLRLGDAVDALEFIGEVIEAHRGTRLGYVDYLARLIPRRSRVGPVGPSLIVPGR